MLEAHFSPGSSVRHLAPPGAEEASPCDIIVLFLDYGSIYYIPGTKQNKKGIQKAPAREKIGSKKLRLVF